MLPEFSDGCPTECVIIGLERALALASEPKINRAELKECLGLVLGVARALDAVVHDEDEEGN